MIFRIHRLRKHILAVGLASLLILTTGAAQAVTGPNIDKRLVQELPKGRVFAPQVRMADLQENAFENLFSRPVRIQPQELTEDQTRKMEEAYNLKTDQQPFDPDQIEELQVESEGTSVGGEGGVVNVITKSSGSGSMPSEPPPPTAQETNKFGSPADGKNVPIYNIGKPQPGDRLSGYPLISTKISPGGRALGGGMTTVEKPPISLGGPIIKDKLWFFGSWEVHERRGFGDQRVWNAYRESPPTRLYVYQQQFVPDLTSLQDLEVTKNGVQKPGFQLFPRFNGVVRVVTKNGITQFGGLYFQEDSLLRKIQDEKAVTPNDPYYMKEGGGGKSSSSKFSVGIGGLLKLGKVAIGVGSGSVGVGAGSVGIGVGKGSVGIDAGPFGIGIGGNSTDQWGLRAVGFTPLDDPASAWRLETARKRT